MRRVLLYTIFIFLTAFCAAYSSSGVIGDLYTTKVCHDSTCTTPTPGIINFKPTGVNPVTIDSVTGLSGMIWGNELGWINLNPTGAGVVFADSTTGVLTGKAWSQVSGWINFALTGQEVKIDPLTGQFSGWAWTGGLNGGWIKFDCSSNDTCISTTWRGESNSTTTTGNTVVPMDTRPKELDVCPNIEGNQQGLPYQFTVTSKGDCVRIIDLCPNISGNQGIIPVGFILNNFGACIQENMEEEIDICINIYGIQKTVPEGMILDDEGDCLTQPRDLCLNIPGFQQTVPVTFFRDENICKFKGADKTHTKSPLIDTFKNFVTKIVNSQFSNKPITNILLFNFSEINLKDSVVIRKIAEINRFFLRNTVSFFKDIFK